MVCAGPGPHRLAVTHAWAPGTGTGSKNYYYLAKDSGASHPELDNHESAGTHWVSPKDAEHLIKMSTNTAGRDHDLATLKAAVPEIPKMGQKAVFTFNLRTKKWDESQSLKGRLPAYRA
jgi:hypothetical protein